MERALYYLGCFIAVVVFESLPRFLFEVNQSWAIAERTVLLLLFLFVAWFFHYTVHGRWRWSVLSSMFFVDSIVAVTLAILLFFQLVSPWFFLVALVVVLIRAFIFSYLVSTTLPHLRGLVFATCFILLLAGELVLTFGIRPF
jgi:hypothetical protein